MDLPPGTDSINVPRLKSPTKVAPQTADAAAVESKDFTDEAIQANVKTLAGQQDIAIQLLEQSPGQIIDRVIMEDLLADYNRLVDRQVLYSAGTATTSLNAGEIVGLFPKTNWGAGAPYEANQVKFEATPGKIPAIAFYQTLGAMASKVSYNRFDLENLHFVLHPRRWFWFATIGDLEEGKTGRPLVNSDSFPGFNIAAKSSDPTPYEGLAGHVPFGSNVYIDGNIPTTATEAGAVTGGTEDFALAGKFDDFWLFEGDLRTRTLPEILSGTLEIRFQVFNYVAFLCRYPQSICFGLGTGMGTPEGAYKQAF
jgi:hypothetical protein